MVSWILPKNERNPLSRAPSVLRIVSFVRFLEESRTPHLFSRFTDLQDTKKLILPKKGCQPILTHHVRIRQRLVNERQIMLVDKLEQLPIGHWKPRSARLILLWVRWKLSRGFIRSICLQLFTNFHLMAYPIAICKTITFSECQPVSIGCF